MDFWPVHSRLIVARRMATERKDNPSRSIEWILRSHIVLVAADTTQLFLLFP
jgi:hypothetical protein